MLRAEIKVVKRFPHSMAVGYVPLSADAALAGDYKDLVFENDVMALNRLFPVGCDRKF